MYRSETTSTSGFVKQLAVQYVAHGYWFYVTGVVPKHKDPGAVDEKLVERYGIDVSRAERSRRKRAGRASVQLLRRERFFVLIATHGEHPFFELEAASIRDIRHAPLKFVGYSISYRGGHASVRIEQSEYVRRKAHLVELATRRSVGDLGELFRRFPFEPYAPVRSQALSIWRAVNRARIAAGLEPVPKQVVRLGLKPVRPFESGAGGDSSYPRAPRMGLNHGSSEGRVGNCVLVEDCE